MKRFTIAILFLLAALQAAALKKDPVYRDARINGALTKVELHIEDDDGMPVEKAKVKAYLGMNFRPRGKWVEGLSDTNGVFVIEGKTCGDEIEVFVDKTGYYDSKVKYCYAKIGAEHEVKDGKWQPYGAEEKIVLRKMKNQMAVSIDGRFVDTKRLNEWIGYDIEKHDFVAPHGSGTESDFQVSIDWDGKWLPDYRGMGVRIRFVEQYSGYYSSAINQGSEFKGPYNANPQAEFLKEARFYEMVSEDHKRTQHVFDNSKCWVVRSRCKVDSNGRLVKSNYSIVHNVSFSGDPDGTGSFRLTGAMNPTPNDTNLEPKREGKGSEGLLKGLEGETVALRIDEKGKVFVGSAQPMTSAIDNLVIRQMVVPRRVGDVVIEGIERYGLAFSETLEEVSIEDGVKLGPAAFYYDVRLKTARLPADLGEIPSSLFSNCVELEGVKIPDGVGRIGDSAFYGTALSSVDVPDSVTYIGHGAFGRCRNLSRVSLPAKVVVEEDAFADCNESILKVVSRTAGAGRAE